MAEVSRETTKSTETAESIRAIREQPNLLASIHNRLWNLESESIKAVLLDKDGTLLDFNRMWGFWTDKVIRLFHFRLADHGCSISQEDIPHIWGTIHDEQGHMIDYDARGPLAMGTMDEVYAVLIWHGYRAGLSWAVSKAIVHGCIQEANLAMEHARPAYPLLGVREFLDQCREKGIRLGVVTADDTDSARKHLEWMGMVDYFEVIVGNDRVLQGKPFADMILLACEELGITPDQTAVIGDTNGDMQMARAADCAIAIGIGTGVASQSADAVIFSFTQLLEHEGVQE
ncbi:HAD family hydrolase [Paenibacillus sp. KACC 21273]|uniref:HAD family hydrolase n=1 Tax=Paenibacillus sp. KACC 21273 TaxID=3025665 RepID=UPI0023657935|nr:HAD family hydrolase [Paenibacillus sp. KACC 21273]WDF50553.1 HAD family hydrolase [Paenibacillus sp. KACC 21273]